MGAIVDSSILIAAERRQLDLNEKLKEFDSDVLIASITAAELMHGLYRDNSPERYRRRKTWLDGIFGSMPILPFDLAVARVYARITAELRSRGQDPGLHDTMIGATAVAHGHMVITRNEKHFERIAGLEVRSW